MDHEKLLIEINNVQDEMAKTCVDSEQYKELLEAFKVLCDVMNRADEISLETYRMDRSLETERNKIESENLANQMKLEEAKYEAKIGLIKTVLGGGIMLTGILMAIYAEETNSKIITSKAWQMVTRLMPKTA